MFYHISFSILFWQIRLHQLLHSDHRSAWILDVIMHFEKEWSVMEEKLMWVSWTYFSGAWFGNTFPSESAFLLLLFGFIFFCCSCWKPQWLQLSQFENSLKKNSSSVFISTFKTEMCYEAVLQVSHWGFNPGRKRAEVINLWRAVIKQVVSPGPLS